MAESAPRHAAQKLDSAALIPHTMGMGPVIVYFLLALVVALGVLGAVALPHLQRRREHSSRSRYTSRTQRAGS